MKVFDKDIKAQGATEYLLMLAAVLVVVAVAVSMLMGMGPNFSASGTVDVQEDGSDLNVVVSDVNLSPDDATLSEIRVLDDGSQVGTLSGIDTSVGSLDSSYTITGSSAAAENITSVVFVDSDGNQASMTPI